MRRVAIALIVVILAAIAFMVFKLASRDKRPDSHHQPMTNEEKMRIAVEVVEGKRPRSDLEKYGIKVGEPESISPQQFLEMAAKERAATQPSSRPTTSPN